MIWIVGGVCLAVGFWAGEQSAFRYRYYFGERPFSSIKPLCWWRRITGKRYF